MSAHALAEQWIDLILKRSADLRRAGVLSVEVNGHSAVFAPGPPDEEAKKADGTAADPTPTGVDAREDEKDPWENPASYPTGQVPAYDVDKELPEIPEFEG